MTNPNPHHTDTLQHLSEARTALHQLQAEICELEFLVAAKLPQTGYLQDQIADHARQLAAGLVGLARERLETNGVHGVVVQ